MTWRNNPQFVLDVVSLLFILRSDVPLSKNTQTVLNFDEIPMVDTPLNELLHTLQLEGAIIIHESRKSLRYNFVDAVAITVDFSKVEDLFEECYALAGSFASPDLEVIKDISYNRDTGALQIDTTTHHFDPRTKQGLFLQAILSKKKVWHTDELYDKMALPEDGIGAKSVRDARISINKKISQNFALDDFIILSKGTFYLNPLYRSWLKK